MELFFFSPFALFISLKRDHEQCFYRPSIPIVLLFSPANITLLVQFGGGERHRRDSLFHFVSRHSHKDTVEPFKSAKNQAIVFDSSQVETSRVLHSHLSRCDAFIFGMLLLKAFTRCCPGVIARLCSVILFFVLTHFGPSIKMVVFVLIFFILVVFNVLFFIFSFLVCIF